MAEKGWATGRISGSGSPLGIFFVVDASQPLYALEHMQTALLTLDLFMAEVGMILSKHFEMNFATQGQGTWPSLAEATLAYKAKIGAPSEPLVRTGALENTASGGEWSINQLGSGNIKAVLPVPGYGAFHVGGTRFMPKRDFSFVADDVAPEIGRLFAAHLFSGMVTSGGGLA